MHCCWEISALPPPTIPTTNPPPGPPPSLSPASHCSPARVQGPPDCAEPFFGFSERDFVGGGLHCTGKPPTLYGGEARETEIVGPEI